MRHGHVPRAVASDRGDLERLARLAPSENGLTVFDADTQETSYGTLVFEGMPFIFDTHRKGDAYVSTIEFLTEVVTPVDASEEEVRRFAKAAARIGAQPIPYSACFFKGNLHVYAYMGPVRGFDLSVVGSSARDAEEKLEAACRSLWSHVPTAVLDAQRDLLDGRRDARYPADLAVLIEKRRKLSGRPRRKA